MRRSGLTGAGINEIVRESADFLAAEIRGRSINITLELRSDLPPIPADRDQLKQAFYNILKNSFHAVKEGGSVIVRAVAGADSLADIVSRAKVLLLSLPDSTAVLACIDEILANGLHAFLTQFLDRVNMLGTRISQNFLIPMAA